MNGSEMGTPCGSSANLLSPGLFFIGAVKREFGWAAFSMDPRFHGRPCQSVSSAGMSPSLPSHHTSPSGVMATFVNSVSFWMDRIAIALLE